MIILWYINMAIKITKEPEMAEVISSAITSRLDDVNTCLPGVIVTYYPGTFTADIALCNKQVFETYLSDNLISEPYPILPNIPIDFPSGGGITMTFPLVAGDNVLVMFSQSDINNFRSNGSSDNEPGILIKHGLSGATAIPCTIKNREDGYFYNDTSAVVISGGGSSDFVALAGLVMDNLNTIKGLFAANAGVPQTFEPTDVAATKLKVE